MDLTALTDHLEKAFARLAGDDDASHDVHHIRRVKSVALEIADMEGEADRSVLVAAAYLHDIVNLPKNSPDRAKASALSADAAVPVLQELGFDERRIEAIRHAIIAHSFSANVAPTTLEAKILQDADRIDALGAIGMARTFFIAGKIGTMLFDGADPFAAERPLDDRRFAIDHFAVKLLKLPETMQTQSGRAIAERRTATIRNFLKALGEELQQPCNW
ncbi:HD domain-containing protein [Rhizobium leguminosarum]|uniref:HD domain-containing protein n=1 Tax=Rhizobium leguminosarum TaxID=384 RepID=UPI0003FC9AE6|nr:HD domain-containing protein [Rhizobium leguminosarum]